MSRRVVSTLLILGLALMCMVAEAEACRFGRCRGKVTVPSTAPPEVVVNPPVNVVTPEPPSETPPGEPEVGPPARPGPVIRTFRRVIAPVIRGTGNVFGQRRR